MSKRIIPLLLCCFFTMLMPLSALAELPESKGPVPQSTGRNLKHDCGPEQSYSIDYPQFGIKAIDGQVRCHVREKAAFIRPECEKWAKDPDTKGHVFEEIVAYELYASSSRYFSVVFEEWYKMGTMPHGRPFYYSMTFDRKTGKRVQLADIFQDWTKAEKALPDLMRAAYAAMGCDVADIAKEFNLERLSGDDRDPFHLEPDGLALYFDFFAIHRWECSPIVLPKEKLLGIGADPKYWQP